MRSRHCRPRAPITPTVSLPIPTVASAATGGGCAAALPGVGGALVSANGAASGLGLAGVESIRALPAADADAVRLDAAHPCSGGVQESQTVRHTTRRVWHSVCCTAHAMSSVAHKDCEAGTGMGWFAAGAQADTGLRTR